MVLINQIIMQNKQKPLDFKTFHVIINSLLNQTMINTLFKIQTKEQLVWIFVNTRYLNKLSFIDTYYLS